LAFEFEQEQASSSHMKPHEASCQLRLAASQLLVADERPSWFSDSPISKFGREIRDAAPLKKTLVVGWLARK